MSQEERELKVQARLTSEVMVLNYFMHNPKADIFVKADDFMFPFTKDMFRIMKANLKKNKGEFISPTEFFNALWKNDCFHYIMNEHSDIIEKIFDSDYRFDNDGLMYIEQFSMIGG